MKRFVHAAPRPGPVLVSRRTGLDPLPARALDLERVSSKS